MKLSIVIPCYNESKSIPLLLSRFSDTIKDRDIEVILVNNGSTDGSQEVIDSLLPQYSFLKVITIPVNQGYGYGILSGLNACTGTYIGWTHADLQTDPRDVVRALEIIEKRKSMNLYIKGWRKNRAFLDEIFTFGMSVFETIYLKKRLTDINAQPNVFPRKFFQKWTNPPHDFSLDLYALYQARKEGLTIVRFPVRFSKRIYGVSSWNRGVMSKWGYIKRTVSFSKRLKKSGSL